MSWRGDHYGSGGDGVQCGNAEIGKPCDVWCDVLRSGALSFDVLSGRFIPPVPGRHVLHFEVTSPSGAAAPHYSRNVVAKNERASFGIPFSLNDPTGDWKIEVRDVASGVKATDVIEIK